jgi:hypothetical protein
MIFCSLSARKSTQPEGYGQLDKFDIREVKIDNAARVLCQHKLYFGVKKFEISVASDATMESYPNPLEGIITQECWRLFVSVRHYIRTNDLFTIQSLPDKARRAFKEACDRIDKIDPTHIDFFELRVLPLLVIPVHLDNMSEAIEAAPDFKDLVDRTESVTGLTREDWDSFISARYRVNTDFCLHTVLMPSLAAYRLQRLDASQRRALLLSPIQHVWGETNLRILYHIE